MTPETYHKRNSDALVASSKSDWFSYSFIQRFCFVGFNQAKWTIEYMLKHELVERHPEKEHMFRIKRESNEVS